MCKIICHRVAVSKSSKWSALSRTTSTLNPTMPPFPKTSSLISNHQYSKLHKTMKVSTGSSWRKRAKSDSLKGNAWQIGHPPTSKKIMLPIKFEVRFHQAWASVWAVKEVYKRRRRLKGTLKSSEQRLSLQVWNGTKKTKSRDKKTPKPNKLP